MTMGPFDSSFFSQSFIKAMSDRHVMSIKYVYIELLILITYSHTPY